MPHYRTYLLGTDGGIVKATESEFEDDEAACNDVRQALVDGGKVEVWSGARCVGLVVVPSA